MAGFGSTMSKLIEDDREYYRELATKKRDYLQTYGTKAVLDRDEKANGAVSLFNNLVTAGIPEDSLRYVLDTTGVAGLSELRSTLNSRDDLTPSQIKGLVKKSKDYVAENPNEDITEVMRRAYGLYKSTDNPVEQETNMFAAVLGLDSRMMEQAALNDVYVDGFKGTDLYAIMARGGPKAGEALSLNLPNKPPSTSEVRMVNEALQDKFEQSIDAKIANLKTQQSDENTTEKAKDIIEEIKALETLKGRGVLGYADWGNIDKTFWDYAKSLEDIKPGYVTLNPTLIEFSSKYNTYWGDKEDDAKLNGNGQQLPAGTGDTGEIKTYTPTELRAALGKGELAVGSKVVVNGNEVVITQAQVNKGKGKAPGLTNDDMGLPDDPVNLGLTDDDMGLPDGSENKFSDNLSTALQKGKSINTWVTSINPEPAITAAGEALDNTVANIIDFVAGVFGADEVPAISEELRKGPPPKKVIAAMQDKTFRDIYDRFSIASDTPMPTEAEKELRSAVDAEVLKRVEEAHRAKILKQQAMNEGVRVLPEVEPVTKDPSATYEYTDQPVPMGTAAEPEPLVARPKKPKEMTSSDKARLKRAQKANELSGDSALLEMLVEKYGIAIVQKEMGL